MSSKYSGRIHDPNHVRSEYDIYFNEELINAGVPDYDQFIGLITREATRIDIPYGVINIGLNAFRGMNNLTKVIIPDSVQRIKTAAFQYIAGEAGHLDLYIPASVTQIESGTFSGASGIGTIYCGFSEGSVQGAPWGAPNEVTIVYDVERPEDM